MSKTILNYAFTKAKLEIYSGFHRKFIHISVAVYGKDYFYGVNKGKTHPKAIIEYGYPAYSFIHSELDLLIHLNNNYIPLQDVHVYNFCWSTRKLFKLQNEPRISRPCVHCAQFIFDARSVTFMDRDREWKTYVNDN